MLAAAHITVALAVLVRTAAATIAVSNPVSSTVCTGGQPCGPFTWTIDDSVLPLGAAFGPTSVGIYVGSVNVQTLFMDLGVISDPTKALQTSAITIPPSLGPNGNFYFLRFQSQSGIDTSTGFPLQAFSAKFSLTGMSGQLSPVASAAIAGSVVPAPPNGLLVSVTTTPQNAAATSTVGTKPGNVIAAAAAATGNRNASNSANPGAFSRNTAHLGAAFAVLAVAYFSL